MNDITKRREPKPLIISNLRIGGRRRAKRPKFKNKDLKLLEEFDVVLGMNHNVIGWSASYRSAYVEDVDDTSSMSSLSTMATMDNNPGAGLTIDKYFYQPVGRAIEKLALRVAIRLNICHPSPAQILRIVGLNPANFIWTGRVEKPNVVIASISAEHPTHIPGILSLVEQSQ